MPSSRPHNFTSPWPDLFRPPTSSITASSRTPFTRDWLVSYTDDDSFRMPRLDSIARRLIEDWLHGRIEVGAAADPVAEIFSDQRCRRRAAG